MSLDESAINDLIERHPLVSDLTDKLNLLQTALTSAASDIKGSQNELLDKIKEVVQTKVGTQPAQKKIRNDGVTGEIIQGSPEGEILYPSAENGPVENYNPPTENNPTENYNSQNNPTENYNSQNYPTENVPSGNYYNASSENNPTENYNAPSENYYEEVGNAEQRGGGRSREKVYLDRPYSGQIYVTEVNKQQVYFIRLPNGKIQTLNTRARHHVSTRKARAPKKASTRRR
jgi:hypothetical protein